MRVLVMEGEWKNKTGDLATDYPGYGLDATTSLVEFEHIGLKKIPSMFLSVVEGEDEDELESTKQLTINVSGHVIELNGEDASKAFLLVAQAMRKTDAFLFEIRTQCGLIYRIKSTAISSFARNFEQ